MAALETGGVEILDPTVGVGAEGAVEEMTPPDTAHGSEQVTTESILVTLPEEPVMLNGIPYMIVCNHDVMGWAFRNTQANITKGAFLATPVNPRKTNVTISFEDDKTRITRLGFITKKSEESVGYDRDAGNLNIQLPRSIEGSPITDTSLVGLYEESIDRLFKRGMSEYRYRESTPPLLTNQTGVIRRLGTVAATILGTASAEDGASNWELVYRGSLGMALGGASLLTLQYAVLEAGKSSYGRKLADKRAAANAGRSISYPMSHWTEKAFSLVPVEAKQPTELDGDVINEPAKGPSTPN